MSQRGIEEFAIEPETDESGDDYGGELKIRDYNIDGVVVKFPFEAYPCQLEMLTNIIRALDGHGGNALLESPTGSGKSMVLLCGVMAWLEKEKKKLDEERKKRRIELDGYNDSSVDDYDKDPDEDFTVNPPGKKAKGFIEEKEKEKQETSSSGNLPKIYICSRTHRQIAQLVRELRRTPYSPNFTVLGSRSHYCVNTKVRNQPGGDLNETCRKACKDQECTYYNSISRRKKMPLSSPNCDIEELVQRGRKERFCPYFAARLAIDCSQLIFAPYNYLLDPLVRESMGIKLEDDIVIIDEAHNVEDTCREAGSYEVTDDQLDQMEIELSSICKALQIYDPSHLLEAHMTQGHMVSIWKNWLRHDQKGGGQVRNDFETTVTTWSGSTIVAELNGLGFTYSYLSQGLSYLEKIFERALDLKNDPTPPESVKQQLEKQMGEGSQAITITLSTGSCQLLKGLYYSLMNLLRDNTRYLSAYRMVKYQTTKTLANAGKRFIFTLGLWCLNPEVVFHQLIDHCKSVVLTSGTLSPMDSFSSELGCNFDHRLEASHIIDHKQTWVGCIPEGPQGTIFLGNFKTMDSFAYQDDLAQAILRVCQVVPAGVLCFLPSYSFLEKLMRRMKSTGIYKQLTSLKHVLEEPKQGTPQVFETLLRKYYRFIREGREGSASGVTGALLFAIYRGKISEGLDLKDDNCRAVIPVGIPYPAFKDPRVVLKREFNDAQLPPRHVLSGQHWYEVQAFRALNQALGRCIRHRHDWGAIVLLEQRFVGNGTRNQRQLSKWVRERLVVHKQFDSAMTSLAQFVQANQEASNENIRSIHQYEGLNDNIHITKQSYNTANRIVGTSQSMMISQSSQQQQQQLPIYIIDSDG